MGVLDELGTQETLAVAALRDDEAGGYAIPEQGLHAAGHARARLAVTREDYPVVGREVPSPSPSSARHAQALPFEGETLPQEKEGIGAVETGAEKRRRVLPRASIVVPPASLHMFPSAASERMSSAILAATAPAMPAAIFSRRGPLLAAGRELSGLAGRIHEGPQDGLEAVLLDDVERGEELADLALRPTLS
jgi:hypothetical protein